MFIFGGFPDLDATWFWPGIPRYLPRGPHLKLVSSPCTDVISFLQGQRWLSWSDSSLDTRCSVQWSRVEWHWRAEASNGMALGSLSSPTHDHLGLPIPEFRGGWNRLTKASYHQSWVHTCACMCIDVCVWVKVLSLFKGIWNDPRRSWTILDPPRFPNGSSVSKNDTNWFHLLGLFASYV